MRRIIIAITGASGVIYGVRALQLLKEHPDIETHAVISPSAFRTALDEIDMSAEEMKTLGDVHYNYKDTIEDAARLAQASGRGNVGIPTLIVISRGPIDARRLEIGPEYQLGQTRQLTRSLSDRDEACGDLWLANLLLMQPPDNWRFVSKHSRLGVLRLP